MDCVPQIRSSIAFPPFFAYWLCLHLHNNTTKCKVVVCAKCGCIKVCVCVLQLQLPPKLQERFTSSLKQTTNQTDEQAETRRRK